MSDLRRVHFTEPDKMPDNFSDTKFTECCMKTLLNLAQPSEGSLIDFAPKKNSSLQFFVDYEELNAIALRDIYPLSGSDECIDLLGESHIYFNFRCKLRLLVSRNLQTRPW